MRAMVQHCSDQHNGNNYGNNNGNGDDESNCAVAHCSGDNGIDDDESNGNDNRKWQ